MHSKIAPMHTQLIPPYGNTLIDLLAAPSEREALFAYANTLPYIQLSERALCDLELLATGAFSPLDRFMGKADYERVIHEMRLVDGTLFPIPILLPIAADAPMRLDTDIALRDARNDIVAIMTVEEIYNWSRDDMAQHVFGTQDARHPLVAEMHRWGERSVSGRLQVLRLPARYDFKSLRLTPAEVRERLSAMGRSNVVAFQTRNPLHRAHEELTKRAAHSADATLLLHPVVGMTKPGDIDHFTRVRAYKALIERYYDDQALLALLPLAMRMAGPREALWHAIIRRNFGANHFIVGRDHAGPGNDSFGRPFYDPYAAQQLVAQHADEIGITMIPFHELVYMESEDRYEEESRVPVGAAISKLSGTQVREDYLERGRALPIWFTRPEVADVLADSYPPRHKQGLCIWFTGLSGAGKSTTAEILTALLMERGRQVTVLDGDVIRTHLSKGLGFSKEDRDTNVLRIGFVASEIVRHGGAVICAAISPYRATRDQVRALVGSDRFIEVFVDTPLGVCEARDTKGMYARARRGEITGFTGIDDPYEAPFSPELTLDTVQTSAEENAQLIVSWLAEHGWLRV
ncbi:MAG: bifunctional sulfate adenylyltransferase/adenylylsulfate kinase [Chloroflexota bacterium]|nr:bifunctional sulfate adenylyltransferase/adenylylsulfate kinase [Chloroflexota bacterium]